MSTDDRGPLDLTRQLEEKDKEIADLKKIINYWQMRSIN